MLIAPLLSPLRLSLSRPRHMPAFSSESPGRPTTDWYTGKRSAGTHRSAGRWPGDEKRTVWVPPAGWKSAENAASRLALVRLYRQRHPFCTWSDIRILRAGVIQDREMLLADARSGRYMCFGPEEDERWETFLTAELPLMPTETLAEFLKQLMVMQDHRNNYQMAVDIEEFDELLVSLQINKGEIAAVFTTDGTTPGYHLVRWVGEPDTPLAMPRVTLAERLNPVRGAPFWYTPAPEVGKLYATTDAAISASGRNAGARDALSPNSPGGSQAVVEVTDMLQTGLTLLPLSDENQLPANLAREVKEDATRRKAVKVDAIDHELIMERQRPRAKLELLIDQDARRVQALQAIALSRTTYLLPTHPAE